MKNVSGFARLLMCHPLLWCCHVKIREKDIGVLTIFCSFMTKTKNKQRNVCFSFQIYQNLIRHTLGLANQFLVSWICIWNKFWQSRPIKCNLCLNLNFLSSKWYHSHPFPFLTDKVTVERMRHIRSISIKSQDNLKKEFSLYLISFQLFFSCNFFP